MTDELFPGFRVPPNDPSREIRQHHKPPPCRPVSTDPAPAFTREYYKTECEKRWDGPALRDARGNWQHWGELHEQLEEAMRKFHRDPMQKDLAGAFHNPSGRLTDFLWTLQSAWNPSPSSLAPLLDFCDHYQRIFLRRGLVIYCTMLLREIEKPQEEAA